MIKINLATLDKNSVAIKVINFSDTQKLLSLEGPGEIYMEETVRIRSRMSWDDLQLIAQLVQICKDQKVQSIQLDVPYFLGARSDRKFEAGGVNYMKQVIAPFINSLGLDAVFVTDPHSIAVENCINNLQKTSILPTLVSNIRITNRVKFSTAMLVAPDEGAFKRTEEVAKSVGMDMIRCVKKRNILTGEITGITVLDSVPENIESLIVVDDICDGGRTFEELAKILPPQKDLYLAVAHGIFSKGFDTLKKYYKKIITTNSVREFTKEELEYVSVYRVI